ncbi:MAG TPA: 4-hydroxy-3-methylbut-2-enyl diphosphate reductase [Bacteroidia bacterium]|nr:4-hydroxy-3-methylbut-2-enyl diphosphate reductase [Bacteroidia bacterium]HNT79619.1 4-hydroxy-3-methylbut-2-enyl diphosphate reductase [Bacteroidia bacterium]
MSLKVTIDQDSGFCFGVVYAIQMAEDELDRNGTLYCLGDIVHNNMEVDRLASKGLKVISHEQLKELKDCKVLIRAHGEPPETYKIALENGIELIDASCPVVLKLQNRVKNSFNGIEDSPGQLVIYGEEGHAEVKGLIGQTKGNAILIRHEEDLEKIDFTQPIHLFSQTTKSTAGFYKMKDLISTKIKETLGEEAEKEFQANDTICRQVSNREPHLRKFAKEHDMILFVSGKKSSNGKALFSVVKQENEKTYFISEKAEINPEWLKDVERIGVCGATSTPMWLMEEISDHLMAPTGTEQ